MIVRKPKNWKALPPVADRSTYGRLSQLYFWFGQKGLEEKVRKHAPRALVDFSRVIGNPSEPLEGVAHALTGSDEQTMGALVDALFSLHRRIVDPKGKRPEALQKIISEYIAANPAIKTNELWEALLNDDRTEEPPNRPQRIRANGSIGGGLTKRSLASKLSALKKNPTPV